MATLLVWIFAWAQSVSQKSLERTQYDPLIAHMLSQIDALTLHAKSSGNRTPLEWAIGQLTQAPEPRFLTMQVIENPMDDQAKTKEGHWVYTRMIDRVNNMGVRITLPAITAGAFGFKSKAVGDFFMAALWMLLVWVFIASLDRFIYGAGIDFSFKKTAEEWLVQAKGLLVELGNHVRKSVESAQLLTHSMTHSRDKVGRVRSQITRELNEIHAFKNELKGSATLQARVETHALNVVLDLSRRSGADLALLDMVEILRRDVAAMRELHEKTLRSVENLEKRYEPWCADLDEAFHSFEQIVGNSEALDTASKRAAKNLIDQAKLIQQKNQVLSKAASTK